MSHKHKLTVLAQQKLFQRINSNAEEHQQATDKRTAEQAAMLERAPESSGEEGVLWSARTAEIKNRITGRKRMARERYIQFAGSSGGMGR